MAPKSYAHLWDPRINKWVVDPTRRYGADHQAGYLPPIPQSRAQLKSSPYAFQYWEQVYGQQQHIIQKYVSDVGRIQYAGYLNQGTLLSRVGFAQHVLTNVAISSVVGELMNIVGSEIQSSEFFYNNLSRLMKNKNARVRQMLEVVAEKAKAETLGRYDARVGKLSPYRGQDSGSNRRYSGGAMRSILKGNNWYRVAPDGIAWIIPSSFDRKARQWYRLNFGAAPAGSDLNFTHYQVKFFGRTMDGPDMDSFPPSRAFAMPAGIWGSQAFPKTPDQPSKVEPFGGRYFYPIGGFKNTEGVTATARRATKGIVGARFLDVGLQSINKNLPAAIEVLAWETVNEAYRAGKSPYYPKKINAAQQAKTDRDRMETLFRREMDWQRQSMRRVLAQTKENYDRSLNQLVFPFNGQARRIFR